MSISPRTAPRRLDDVAEGVYDAVVMMGCGDSCPGVQARQVLEWDIPDPKHLDPVEFGVVRDRIGAEVRALIDATPRDERVSA